MHGDLTIQRPALVANCLNMQRFFIIARIFVVLALAGLVSAPLGASIVGAAMAAQDASMQAGNAMPCCPDEQPRQADCATDCPFVAACMSVLSGLLVPLSLAAHSPSGGREAVLPSEDFSLSSLAGDPPSRPPRA
jgi:hypothetical protein